MKWLYNNIIYLTMHGSNAYGLATDQSDVDLKGICIPPVEVENDLFNNFNQAENNVDIAEKHAALKNPNNPKLESAVYSLKKFMQLAVKVNPNIIEILFTDAADRIIYKNVMDPLMENRDLFLSSRANFSFSGYAWSQLAKINRHRKWIVAGELKPPVRTNFGLPLQETRGFDEITKYVKQKMEQWNLNQYPLDDTERSDLIEKVWEIINEVSQSAVTWGNWPEVYQLSIQNILCKDLNLSDELTDLVKAEYAYRRAVDKYNSWVNWKKNRNQDRFALETKSGYDTKHASHLVRLLRMGFEILTDHKVVVKRPDRDELLDIKNGGWTYDKVMEYTELMQKKLDKAYKTTTLPRSVDYVKINELYHSIVTKYHQS